MTWRRYALLGGLGLAFALMVSRFQPFPGYLDSDYYFAGGLELARGHGFSAPIIWNYLDDPQGLPHPSHSYWMPMASIISAAGMGITGRTTYEAGRLGFLLLAALVPVLTARLAWAFSRKPLAATVSGMLAVFSIYYAPFLPVPDNYGTYIVLGGLFLLAVGRPSRRSSFVMGLLAGAMTLSRSDGLMWLVLAVVAVMLPDNVARPSGSGQSSPVGPLAQIRAAAMRWLLIAVGFLFVMGPWFVRNLNSHGALMAPGGERLIWLTSYNETFAFPAEQITASHWLAQGLADIVADRVAALRWNLLNAVAAQGGLFLLPFIVIGAWTHRRDRRVQVAACGWLGIFGAMTLIFPFAGARGGFFHAGASVQSLWWALAPLGLEASVEVARRRGMFTPDALRVFSYGLIGIAMVMTTVILSLRVFGGWGEGEDRYSDIDSFLERHGAQAGEVVMVRNPPGYFIMTGRPAIVVPYAAPSGMLAAARQFGADYLVLEPAGAAGPIKTLYDGAGGDQFELIGDLDGTRVFRIKP